MQQTNVVHQGVVDHLASLGRPVGLGAPPAGGGWQGTPGDSTFRGYAVVWGTDGRPLGTLADRHAYGRATVQVSCWAGSATGASELAARCRAELLGLVLPDPVRLIAVVHQNTRGPYRDPDVPAETAPWQVYDQWTIETT